MAGSWIVTAIDLVYIIGMRINGTPGLFWHAATDGYKKVWIDIDGPELNRNPV